MKVSPQVQKELHHSMKTERIKLTFPADITSGNCTSPNNKYPLIDKNGSIRYVTLSTAAMALTAAERYNNDPKAKGRIRPTEENTMARYGIDGWRELSEGEWEVAKREGATNLQIAAEKVTEIEFESVIAERTAAAISAKDAEIEALKKQLAEMGKAKTGRPEGAKELATPALPGMEGGSK